MTRHREFWTDEENAVLIECALRGDTSEEIAGRLFRTLRSVQAHRSNLVSLGLLPRAAGGTKPADRIALRPFTDVGPDKIRMSISPWQPLPDGVLVRTIEAV